MPSLFPRQRLIRMNKNILRWVLIAICTYSAWSHFNGIIKELYDPVFRHLPMPSNYISYFICFTDLFFGIAFIYLIYLLLVRPDSSSKLLLLTFIFDSIIHLSMYILVLFTLFHRVWVTTKYQIPISPTVLLPFIPHIIMVVIAFMYYYKVRKSA